MARLSVQIVLQGTRLLSSTFLHQQRYLSPGIKQCFLYKCEFHILFSLSVLFIAGAEQ